MTGVWAECLADRYEQVIELLERALVECPDELWERSVWQVRVTDRHAWPIKAGIGEGLPDDERLQLHSSFWFSAYHALLALHQYLDGALAPVPPPPPLLPVPLHELPRRVHGREELLDYAAFCRQRVDAVVRSLTDDAAAAPTAKGRPFADLLLHNLLHLQDHVSQLNLFLNRNAEWSDGRWATSARWFEPCPDCEA